MFPVGNLCFQFKGNYFDREFVLAFWTRARESLLRILFLERDIRVGTCVFYLEVIISRGGFLCFRLVLGWRENSKSERERERESVSEVGRRMGMDGEMNDLGD